MQHLGYSGVGHVGGFCGLAHTAAWISVWKSQGRKSREGSEVAMTKISAPGSSEGMAGTSLGPGLSKTRHHMGSPGFHHDENPLILTRLLIFMQAKE